MKVYVMRGLLLAWAMACAAFVMILVISLAFFLFASEYSLRALMSFSIFVSIFGTITLGGCLIGIPIFLWMENRLQRIHTRPAQSDYQFRGFIMGMITPLALIGLAALLDDGTIFVILPIVLPATALGGMIAGSIYYRLRQ